MVKCDGVHRRSEPFARKKCNFERAEWHGKHYHLQDTGVSVARPRGTVVNVFIREGRRPSAFLIALVALAGAWWIASQLARPMEVDQGIFVWAGDVIRHGGLMYRDAWDVKGPLVYYLAAAAEFVFGHHFWAFRALDVLWQLAAAPLIFATARRTGAGSFGAAVAVALYFIWFTANESGNAAQPDAWAGILLCGVALLLLRSPRKPATLAYCGVLIGICCLIKPTYGMFLLLPAIYFIAEPTWSSRFRALALTTAGFVLPLLLSIAFFAAHGALKDYYDTYIGFNLSVYSVKDALSWPGRAWIAFRIMVLSFRFFFPVLIAVLGIATLARRAPRDATMLAVWLLLTVFNVMIQGKMIWLYHYVPVYLPLAIAAGIGVFRLFAMGQSALATSSNPRMLLMAFGAACVIPIGTVCGGAALNMIGWTRHVLTGSTADGYDEREFREWGEQPGAIPDASNYVREHTGPNDLVFFTNDWAGGNFLSRRASPTRLTNPRTYMDAPTSPYGRAYGQELLTALNARPPAYVVAAGPALCNASDFQGEYCINHAPLAFRWLSANYVIERRLRWVDIWRRRN